MKGNLQIILTTVVLFVAGLLVGIWTQHARPLPPPPIGPMGEFGAFGEHLRAAPPFPPVWVFNRGPYSQPPNPAAIRRHIEVMRTQSEEFQKQLSVIEQQFRTAFEQILTPAQKTKLETIQQWVSRLPPPLPGCGPELGPIFVSTIIYRPVYDRLSHDLALSQQQRRTLTQLLMDRRSKLLALVDNRPPPSFALGEIVGPQPGPPE
jgi:hypothetical protein